MKTDIRSWLMLSPGDPGFQMLRQATLGDVDFITGDYLAGEHVSFCVVFNEVDHCQR